MANLMAFLLRHRVGALVALVALASDQAAKFLVTQTLVVGESWSIAGLFHLTHATNSGSALGLFSGHTIVLIVVSAIGLGVLFVYYWSRPRTSVRTQVSFGLMLAGAVGNLADRVVIGHVTDFIDIVPLFIFNLADASILIGLIGFAWEIPHMTRTLAKLSGYS